MTATPATDSTPAVAAAAPARPSLPRLDSLTGLRFAAAFAVLLHHSPNLVTIPAIRPYTQWGQLGVSFFFVLSGFVLVWSRRRGDTAGRFYWRRFARIWPMLAVATVLAVPVFYQGRDIEVNVTGVLLSVLLLQAWFPDSGIYLAGNPAAWSLSCEAFFYAVFPFLAPRFGKRGVRGLAVIGVTVVLLAFVFAIWVNAVTDRVQWPLYINPAFRVAEFILGMLLATAISRGWRPPWTMGTSLALLALWVVILSDTRPRLSSTGQELLNTTWWVVSPLLFVLIIGAAAQRDLDGRRSIWRTRPLIKLGEWSYALYLTHATLLHFLLQRYGVQPAANSSVWILLAYAAAAIALAAVCYTIVEHPVEKYLRGIQRRWIAHRAERKARRSEVRSGPQPGAEPHADAVPPADEAAPAGGEKKADRSAAP